MFSRGGFETQRHRDHREKARSKTPWPLCLCVLIFPASHGAKTQMAFRQFKIPAALRPCDFAFPFSTFQTGETHSPDKKGFESQRHRDHREQARSKTPWPLRLCVFIFPASHGAKTQMAFRQFKILAALRPCDFAFPFSLSKPARLIPQTKKDLKHRGTEITEKRREAKLRGLCASVF